MRQYGGVKVRRLFTDSIMTIERPMFPPSRRGVLSAIAGSAVVAFPGDTDVASCEDVEQRLAKDQLMILFDAIWSRLVDKKTSRSPFPLCRSR
jgi:hypothetical protein